MDRQLVERIKEHFGRKSTAHLQRVAQGGDPDRWSPEAVAAASEVIADRMAGRASEPTDPEEDMPPPSGGHDADGVALMAGLSLLALPLGWMVLPVNRNYEPDLVAQDHPIPFGPGIAWLAVETTDTSAVADALGLQVAREASWAEGLEAAYRTSVFVTPPLGDWTLAVSAALLPSQQLAEFIKPTLERLSRRFGDAQYFCTHVEADLHAWAWASGGQFLRGYAWLGRAGRAIWDEGALSQEEHDLEISSARPPDEQIVLQLAALRSIDPTTLDEQFKEPTLGQLGNVSDSFGRVSS